MRNRRSRWLTAACLGLVLFTLACRPRQTGPSTTVIVVRHAEKTDSGDDPQLSPEGEQRALRLRDMTLDAGVSALFATRYRRTQETLEPLAAILDIEVEIIDAPDFEGLSSRILSEHRGSTVVVAGHSNTVPAIVSALGAEEPDPIDESQYDNLFIVTVPASGESEVLRLHF